MMKSAQFISHASTKNFGRFAQFMSATFLATMMSTQAMAMLPTPEAELRNPTNLETATIASQNTVASAATQASNERGISSKITASLLTVDANGQETLVPIDANTRLQSGNIIEYHGYFTNNNVDRVRKMTVTMTIPEQVELLRVISPEFGLASVDGATFSRMPLKTIVNGQRQDVPLTYYRTLRWDLEGLGLNETTVVKYRAKLK